MRTEDKRNKIIYFSAAFLLPLLFLLLFFSFNEIAPFGNSTLVFCDAQGQYISYFKYYRDMLLGEQDAFYMFEKNLGGSVVGLFAYYLASPLNLIFLLFPEDRICAAFDILIALKISLCSLTMSAFLAGTGRLNRHSILFESAYAFCGYNSAFCWSVMWLDGVILLPLIALGLYRLVRENKNSLYVFSLAAAIISSFYIGFALCIFSLLYYVYLQMLERSKTDVLFLISSLLAGGISSILLLPAVLSFSGGKRKSGFSIIGEKLVALHEYALGYLKSDAVILAVCLAAAAAAVFLLMSIIRRKRTAISALLLGAAFIVFYSKIEFFLQGNRDILIKTIFGTLNTAEITEGSPNIYSGELILMLAVCFFACREIPKKEKRAAAFFCGVMLLSFALFVPNMIWHGFTKNAWFNYRYSFIFSFFIIALAEKAFCVPFSDMALLSLVPVAGAVIKRPDYIPIWLIIFELFFIVALYFAMKKSKKTVAAVAQICVLCAIFAFNLSAQSSESVREDEYAETYNRYSQLLDTLKAEDDGFYRIRKYSPWLSYNDPMTFGYPGISHFSSTEKTATIEYLKKAGYFTYEDIYACADDENYYATDDFLGVKYYIEKDGTITENLGAKSLAFSEAENCRVYVRSDSRITIKTETGGELTVTIPFEKGWRAYIDGKQTEISEGPDIFMKVTVPDGEHSVELRFVPPGLLTGSVISVVSLFAFVTMSVLKKRKNK